MDRKDLMDAVADGRFFGVKFVKRTDGSVRSMNARVGVKSQLRGGEKAFKDEDKDLLTVFDVQKSAYRSIPLENVLEVKAHGRTVYRHPQADAIEEAARKPASKPPGRR